MARKDEDPVARVEDDTPLPTQWALAGYIEGRCVKSEEAFIKRQRLLLKAMRQPGNLSAKYFYDGYTDGYWVEHGYER